MSDQGQTNLRRCPECGASYPQDSDFCYSCGAMYRDDGRLQDNFDVPPGMFQDGPSSASDPASVNSFIKNSMEGVADTVQMLVLLWAVIGTSMGVISLINAEYLKQFINFPSGYALGPQLMIVSGMCALVSAYLLKKRKSFMPCVLLCAAAAVIVVPAMRGSWLMGFLCCMAGFNMTFAIYRIKPIFDNGPN